MRHQTAGFVEDNGLTFDHIIRDPHTDLAAALKVCSDARDVDDARLILAALGLIDTDRPDEGEA